jgi:Flagellar motor protein
MSEQRPTIIVRRVKKVAGGGHHGGSWKVAYADFVTAMMAFFLVMWLMGATTNKERAAISEYFRNPSPLSGKSFSPAPGPAGPGGASTSMIKLGGTMDLPKGESDNPFDKPPGDAQQVSEQQEKAQEKQRLETLMQALQEAIGKSQALEPFKDQLLLDLTPEGLRIQIVDQQNRPMFDLGGTVLKPYTQGSSRSWRPSSTRCRTTSASPAIPTPRSTPPAATTPTGNSAPDAPTPRAVRWWPVACTRTRCRASSACRRRCCSTNRTRRIRSTAASASW